MLMYVYPDKSLLTPCTVLLTKKEKIYTPFMVLFADKTKTKRDLYFPPGKHDLYFPTGKAMLYNNVKYLKLYTITTNNWLMKTYIVIIIPTPYSGYDLVSCMFLL